MTYVAALEASASKERTYKGHFNDSLISLLVGGTIFGFLFSIIAFSPSPWWQPQVIVPTVGMIVGNAISGPAVAVDIYLMLVTDQKHMVDTRLSFGSTGYEAVLPFVKQGITASLLPMLNRMSVVGIVAIPGMMAGQLLGGAKPLVAAEYQMDVESLDSTNNIELQSTNSVYRVSYEYDVLETYNKTNEIILSLDSINLLVNDIPLFDPSTGLNLTIKLGERLAVQGPSGIEESIEPDNRNYNHRYLRSLFSFTDDYNVPRHRRQVLYVPQALPPMTLSPQAFIIECLEFYSRKDISIYQTMKINIEALCKSMEIKLGLTEGKLSEEWSSLSGGERQRAIIGCGLILSTINDDKYPPMILLLDEPTAACDNISSTNGVAPPNSCPAMIPGIDTIPTTDIRLSIGRNDAVILCLTKAIEGPEIALPSNIPTVVTITLGSHHGSGSKAMIENNNPKNVPPNNNEITESLKCPGYVLSLLPDASNAATIVIPNR
eukprot:gene20015-25990_t